MTHFTWFLFFLFLFLVGIAVAVLLIHAHPSFELRRRLGFGVSEWREGANGKAGTESPEGRQSKPRSES